MSLGIGLQIAALLKGGGTSPATWGAIGALIGTVVGAAASVVTAYIATRHAASLQAADDQASRRDQGRAFQRETLLALQEALSDLLRLETRCHLGDRHAFRSSGIWGENAVGETLSEENRLARRWAMILKERVADDALRVALDGFCGQLTQVSLVDSEAEAVTLFERNMRQATPMMEHIGRTLRAQYDH